MNEQLIDKIIEISMNNKIIDQSFIKKNIKLLLNDYDLKEYISMIKFSNNKFKGSFKIPQFIDYNKENNDLTIYKNEIDSYYRLYTVYDDLFNETERPLFYNLIILRRIICEIEQINQKKIIDDNCLISDILKICYYDLDNNISLSNRLANYEANNKIVNIFNNNSSIFYLYFDSLKALDLINGYSHRMILNKECPTINYLKIKDRLDILKKYDWYSDSEIELYDNIVNEIATEERLKYGLYINEEEMYKVLSHSKSIKSNK